MSDESEWENVPTDDEFRAEIDYDHWEENLFEERTPDEIDVRRARRARRAKYQRIQAWVILAGTVLTVALLLASGVAAAVSLAALFGLAAWGFGREAR